MEEEVTARHRLESRRSLAGSVGGELGWATQDLGWVNLPRGALSLAASEGGGGATKPRRTGGRGGAVIEREKIEGVLGLGYHISYIDRVVKWAKRGTVLDV